MDEPRSSHTAAEVPRMGHHDDSLIDKVKNALGMGDDEGHDEADDLRAEDTGDRADGWAGVPAALYDDTSAGAEEESGLGRNPGPDGSARYEAAAGYDDLGGADADADGALDMTREDAVATEYGGAYGMDDTPMPTAAAFDRGEAPPPGVASFGTEDVDMAGTEDFVATEDVAADGWADEVEDATLEPRGTGI